MPDVKWFLKWNYDDKYHLSLNVESQNEIEYTINLYTFTRPDVLAYNKNGKLNGKEMVELQSDYTYTLNIINDSLINGKLHITVDGYFSYISYTKKQNFPFSDTITEWGSCLKEVFPTDFDIHVENQIIKITKNFVAIESSVFARMFGSDGFKEAKENKVTITDAQFEIVEAAMNFCYRQNITYIFEDLNKCIELLYFCD
uniref:BTB domain-containing protein n=1 Tax=Panagrolaimus davidi TaxID=227884 RepID=A0A914P0L4_9BILA